MTVMPSSAVEMSSLRMPFQILKQMDNLGENVAETGGQAAAGSAAFAFLDARAPSTTANRCRSIGDMSKRRDSGHQHFLTGCGQLSRRCPELGTGAQRESPTYRWFGEVVPPPGRHHGLGNAIDQRTGHRPDSPSKGVPATARRTRCSSTRR